MEEGPSKFLATVGDKGIIATVQFFDCQIASRPHIVVTSTICWVIAKRGDYSHERHLIDIE